ncbi:MAG: OmpA family protein, partial [Paracoccaceae bacterium]
LRQVSKATALSDFIETADFAQPPTWDAATRFAVGMLADLPRAKVSVTATQVTLIAMAPTPADRDRITRDLRSKTPDGVRLSLDLSVPRPVVSPYTLRFVRNGNGARFDACHAPDAAARDKINAAADAAGLSLVADTPPVRDSETGSSPASSPDASPSETASAPLPPVQSTPCRIALGAPNTRWSEAAELALGAVARLSGGALTMTDTDVALIAPATTSQDLFDTVARDLAAALPDGFNLTPVLPGATDTEGPGPAQFTATLSPEGLVQLRGQINSQVARQSATSFAQALFGTDVVRMAAQIDGTLPASWPLRVLAGMAALGELNNGAVTVSPAHLSVRGTSYNSQAPAVVSALLTERLGEGALFDISIRTEEPPETLMNSTPAPEECVAQLSDIIGKRKITFEPGSATLDGATMPLMDEIAELLKLCGEFPLEIQGHTDSQGREVMNQELSQARAQAVLDALFSRRVLTGSYTARGYGEAQPIADNGSETGREANRRIEFVLIRSAPSPEEITTLERSEQSLPEDDTQ